MSKLRVGLSPMGMYNANSWHMRLEEVGYNCEVEYVDINQPQPFDIIIFDGGEDVSPEYYGEVMNPRTFSSIDRDVMESRIFNHYIERVQRIVGICRGIQFINVMLGGDLHQDLFEKGMGHKGTHEVIPIKPSSVLMNKFLDHSGKSFVVNSLHHQAVKNLSPKLVATLIEPNTRVIEGVNQRMDTRLELYNLILKCLVYIILKDLLFLTICSMV